jgi:hypothetical protein
VLHALPISFIHSFIHSIFLRVIHNGDNHLGCRRCLHNKIIFLIILREEYKLWSSSLCSFLQPPVTSSLFGPNILHNTLFSNTLSLCSSLNVRDEVSHPYRLFALYCRKFMF